MQNSKVFMVRNLVTGEFLDLSNGWSRSEIGLAKFATEEAATAAFPENVRCAVISRSVRTERNDSRG